MTFNIFKKVVIAFCLVASMGACTSEFEKINTNPVASLSMDPAILLSYNLVSVSGHVYEMWRGNVLRH